MELKSPDFFSLSKDELFEALETQEKGLYEKEAKERISKYGKNTLPKKGGGSGILLFLKQFNSSLIYILFIASFISWKFEHYIDAYVILAIIFLNSIIGFIQSWRAEKILEALKNMVVLYARVIREGIEVKVAAEELVTGDIVVLESGDGVPADLRLIEARNIRSDESTLTGESTPVTKDYEVLKENKEENPFSNMVFMGTTIVSGYGIGVVVNTGVRTRLGTIAENIKKIRYEKTHFEKKVDELVFQMGGIAVGASILIFLIGFYFKGLAFFDIFLFSVASLVAGVPEGLPAVLTIVLAIGASRMARKNAIVKFLPSVETLGVANVICTDKTGTLTKNVLTVTKMLVGSKLIKVSGTGTETKGNFWLDEAEIIPEYYPDLKKMLDVGVLTSDASLSYEDDSKHTGDPVEISFEIAALKGGIKKGDILKDASILDKIPFDTKYKYKANLINFGKEGHPEKEIFTAGAFEILLKRSTHILAGDKVEKLTESKKDELLKYALDMAEDALKVVGVAYKTAEDDKETISHGDIEDLVFLGFFGMIDPPKDGVAESIEKCKEAGIRVLMLTGDHKATAVAIAKDIGLLSREVDPDGKVATEADLEGLSDEEFKERVDGAVIFARVTPETKLRVAKILQNEGNIVAMTGDGVNDAPALKQANIGVSMGIQGTMVAKEASSMVLADDNFSSIVSAISVGRTVFNNVKKTSFYLITTNVAESATIISALFAGLALPLSPIQILWLNLITDGIPVIALATEKDQDGILNKKPRSKDEKILSKDVIPLLFFTVLLMAVGAIFLLVEYMPYGIDKARTMVFSFMAFSQLFNIMNMRSLETSIFKIGFFSNKFLAFSLIISVLVQIFVVYNPFFQKIFGFTSLNSSEWILIVVFSSVILFVVEIYKYLKNRE